MRRTVVVDLKIKSSYEDIMEELKKFNMTYTDWGAYYSREGLVKIYKNGKFHFSGFRSDLFNHPLFSIIPRLWLNGMIGNEQYLGEQSPFFYLSACNYPTLRDECMDRYLYKLSNGDREYIKRMISMIIGLQSGKSHLSICGEFSNIHIPSKLLPNAERLLKEIVLNEYNRRLK